MINSGISADFGPDWFSRFCKAHTACYPEAPASPVKLIYCISEGAGKPVKIGMTRDAQGRLRTIQSSSPVLLHLFWSAPGQRMVESAFHRLLRPRQMWGEWFDDRDDLAKLGDGSAADRINAIAAAMGSPKPAITAMHRTKVPVPKLAPDESRRMTLDHPSFAVKDIDTQVAIPDRGFA